MPDAGQPNTRFQYHYNFCGGVVSRPSGGNQDLGVQVSLTACPPHAPHNIFCPHSSSHQHNNAPSPKHIRVHSLSTTCTTLTCTTRTCTTHAHAPHTPFYAHTSYHQHNNAPYRKHLPDSRPARASRRRGSHPPWPRVQGCGPDDAACQHDPVGVDPNGEYYSLGKVATAKWAEVTDGVTIEYVCETTRTDQTLVIRHSHAHRHGAPCSIHKQALLLKPGHGWTVFPTGYPSQFIFVVVKGTALMSTMSRCRVS